MKQLNWYQIFGKSNIPDGRTVLPTDDIQIWLHCADIWDKSYTTLAEVLADTDTLLALISSNNAVDYMVRSTTWAVATALVPTMTSDTTPEGECVATNANPSYPAWKAFDKQPNTFAVSNSVTDYIGYIFTTPVVVNRLGVVNRGDTTGVNPITMKVQATNDGVNWTDVSEVLTNSSEKGSSKTFDFDNSTAYLGYNVRGITSGTYTFQLAEIQFYSPSITTSATAMTYIGLNNYASNTLLADATWCNAICNSEYLESVLNVKVPTMTDNTHPSGEASASTVYQTNYAYKAFDGNDSTKWECGFVASDLYPYVQYDFGSNVKICCAKAFEKGSSGNAFIYGHKIEYSEDNVTFTEATSGESSSITASQSYNVLESFPLVTGRYFRFRSWRANQEQFSGGDIYTLQFYGREDV
jgi:hypothetical protein